MDRTRRTATSAGIVLALAIAGSAGAAPPDGPLLAAGPGTQGTPGFGPLRPNPMLQGLTISIYSSRVAELTWRRLPNVTSTRVARNDGVAGVTTGTSFVDRRREPGERYLYTVTALDDDGQVVAIGRLDDTVPPLPSASPTPAPPTPAPPPITEEPPAPVDPDDPSIGVIAGNLVEDRSIYEADGYGRPEVVRVDLRTVTASGPCTADEQSGCTLADVIADVDKTDDKTVDIAVHFRADDFADDGQISNAELRLRGGGSRFAPQKSFRVKLDSKDVLWRGERFLQLNKHPFDSSRIRNKLAMDLMSGVPHLASFRTAFVNLWIDDGNGAVDYGLFTHVERGNDDYLERHGLDAEANLYKADDFRFEPSDLEDVRVDAEGRPLDEDRFESSLAIEEGEDHRALVRMLEAVNDPERSFASVLEAHFNEENVLAWMATNILLRQNDATRHNYYLYNPKGTETFFFLPWDYDAAVSSWSLPAPDDYSNDALRRRSEYGYALAGDSLFFDRYFRLPGIHQRLVDRAGLIRRSYLDDARVSELAERHASLVAPFMATDPDRRHNAEYRQSSWQSRAAAVGDNARAVREDFGVPVPPTLATPRIGADGVWTFAWTPGLDPTGGEVRYDLQVSRSADFDAGTLVIDDRRIDGTRRTVDAGQLGGGTWYARLIARPTSDPDRLWTPSANKATVDGVRRYGAIAFTAP